MLSKKKMSASDEETVDLSSFPHLTPQAPVKTNPFLEELRTIAQQTISYQKKREEKYGNLTIITEKDQEKADLIEAIVTRNKNRLYAHTMNHTCVREPCRIDLWSQDEFPDIRDIVWHKLCMLGLDLYLCPYGNIYVNPSSWLPPIYY